MDRRRILVIILFSFTMFVCGVCASSTIIGLNISYSNTKSGLESTNVQEAIDEIYDEVVNGTRCPNGYICELDPFGDGTLGKIMKTNASNATIDFSVRSGVSGTNGIYSTDKTEDESIVYYYRGTVNNNLIFNNMCWKVIRTTETGGIRIIYNGLPTNGECNATGDDTLIGSSKYCESNTDNAYVGYMYGTVGADNYNDAHTNTNDSYIKENVVDPWYVANFTSESILSKISDSVYCNDRSISFGGDNNTVSTSITGGGYGTLATVYGAMSRSAFFTSSPNPSFSCSQKNDKFSVSKKIGNGKLKYPVALITSDEAVFAGFNTRSSNSSDYKDTDIYLYSGAQYYTMTPAAMDASGLLGFSFISAVGSLAAGSPMADRGVRPVITLIPGIKVNGTGTSENPYVVQ